MNLPEFHLNKTIKSYINRKLSKTSNPLNTQNLTEKILLKKNSDPENKKNKNNNLSRIKTVTDIINPKKFLKKQNSHKTKLSFTPISDKKINQSKDKYKTYTNNKKMNYPTKNKVKRAASKSPKKNLNNSEHKYQRQKSYNIIRSNLTNPQNNKTISKYPQENKILSNDSTLESKNIKSLNTYGHTTSKKSKFNNQFFAKEKK